MWQDQAAQEQKALPREPLDIWSIGHGDLELLRFVELLRAYDIAGVADLRTVPYRARCPQFNREPLAAELTRAGIAYEFFGAELGGTPQDPAYWQIDGRPDFARIAASEAFRDGLHRLLALAGARRTAVMADPTNPWRGARERLVGRNLRALGCRVHYIAPDGTEFADLRASPD